MAEKVKGSKILPRLTQDFPNTKNGGRVRAYKPELAQSVYVGVGVGWEVVETTLPLHTP